MKYTVAVLALIITGCLAGLPYNFNPSTANQDDTLQRENVNTSHNEQSHDDSNSEGVHLAPTYSNVEIQSSAQETKDAPDTLNSNAPLYLLLQNKFHNFTNGSSTPPLQEDSQNEETTTEKDYSQNVNEESEKDKISRFSAHSRPITNSEHNTFVASSQFNSDNDNVEIGNSPQPVFDLFNLNNAQDSDFNEQEDENSTAKAPTEDPQETRFHLNNGFRPSFQRNLNKRDSPLSFFTEESDDNTNTPIRSFHNSHPTNLTDHAESPTSLSEGDSESSTSTITGTVNEEPLNSDQENRFQPITSRFESNSFKRVTGRRFRTTTEINEPSEIVPNADEKDENNESSTSFIAITVNEVPLDFDQENNFQTTPSNTDINSSIKVTRSKFRPTTEASASTTNSFSTDEEERIPVKPVRSFNLLQRNKDRNDAPNFTLFNEENENSTDVSTTTETASTKTETASSSIQENTFDLTPLTSADSSPQHNINKRESQFNLTNTADAQQGNDNVNAALHRLLQNKKQAEIVSEESTTIDFTTTEETEIETTTTEEEETTQHFASNTDTNPSEVEKSKGIFSTLMNLFRRKPTSTKVEDTEEESTATEESTSTQVIDTTQSFESITLI